MSGQNPAMDYPTIDHRGPDFAKIGAECLGIKTIFKTDSQVIYPASGTGLKPPGGLRSDLVLMIETGLPTLAMASRLVWK